MSEPGKVHEPKIEPIDKRPPGSFGQLVVLRFLQFITHFLYRLRYHGMEHVPAQGPFILVANHQSMFDVTAILCKFRPWVYMLAKSELYKYALPSRFFYWYGAFPVNRKKPELSTIKRSLAVLRRGGVIGLFPEGTRVKRAEHPRVHPPSTGAVYFARKANCPILPVSINKPYRLFRKNHVYVGAPLSLETLAESAGSTDLQAISDEMMRRVYALQNYEY